MEIMGRGAYIKYLCGEGMDIFWNYSLLINSKVKEKS